MRVVAEEMELEKREKIEKIKQEYEEQKRVNNDEKNKNIEEASQKLQMQQNISMAKIMSTPNNFNLSRMMTSDQSRDMGKRPLATSKGMVVSKFVFDDSPQQ